MSELNTDRNTAKIIRRAMQWGSGNDVGDDSDLLLLWQQASGPNLSRAYPTTSPNEYMALHVIDLVWNGAGVEGIVDPDDFRRGISYVNTGDLYIPTVVFSGITNTWQIASVGDILEAHPQRWARNPAMIEPRYPEPRWCAPTGREKMNIEYEVHHENPAEDSGEDSDDDNSMQIYVACLSSYNNGVLHGRWINAHQDASDIEAEIDEMLSKSAYPLAEEWAIHDYRNSPVELDEFESIENVAALAELVDEHGYDVVKAAAILEGPNVEYITNTIENFFGAYVDLAEWGAESIESALGNDVPEWLWHYIDYRSYARNAEANGEVQSARVNGVVYVFSS